MRTCDPKSAGADTAVVRIESESEVAALTQLERIAQKVLWRRHTESRQGVYTIVRQAGLKE